MKTHCAKRESYATPIIFGIYLLVLIWLVLFKFAFSFSDIQMLCGDRSVNFIPFYYDSDVGRFHLREVIMNILVFVPFGMYMRMLCVPVKRTLLFGLGFSIILELIQFISTIGAADITDVITNTLGSLVGICLYLQLSKLLRKKERADRFINILGIVALSLFFTLAVLLALAN